MQTELKRKNYLMEKQKNLCLLLLFAFPLGVDSERNQPRSE